MLRLAAAAAALAASLAFAVVFDGPVDTDTCQTPACLTVGSQVMAGLGCNTLKKLRQGPAEAMLGKRRTC